MNQEERDLIARFVARVSGQNQGLASSGGAWGASVPATTTPALPPIDPEADAFIKESFQRYPEAPYRITQTAVVQEAALAEAQNRIRRLEWELQQARAQQAQPRSGGLFGGLFGGNRAQQPPPNAGPNYGPQGYPQQGYGPQGYPPPPQQAYPPGYNPGMFQQRGSGFLGSALTTAAGVAGGMVAGNAIMDLFGGHHGGGFGDGGYGGETVINNNYGDAAAGAGGDPWGGSGTGADSYDQGGGFDNAPADQGFDTGGTFDSGGWDDNSF